MQPWPRRLVVATICDPGDPPVERGYRLAVVRHEGAWWVPQTLILALLGTEALRAAVHLAAALLM